ncbi:CPBP family intramembrane glutamic endopeptidase [Henriciella aquimarina]|uniref:CPBP family intramembrane glutamic endopeptidase n=1 Tax=Henriciella aquimarina TaxID=545261 RepID=UPI0009FD6DCC|nr:type II CAAX endopeptidase family protein [Henriciella aquimarina]
MEETGPYNTPLALAREPFTAAFWVLCAPFLFPVVGVALAGLFWPGFSETVGNAAASGEAIAWVWITLALIHLAHFAILSVWSERIGAGPFAGAVKASQNWIIAAVLLGPVVLIGPNIVIGAIFGGTEGWEYSGEVNTALYDPGNWGPAYLAFACLLAPLLEEVTFRGVALGALLARGVPAGMAAVVSTAAFTFIHLQYSVPALAIVFIAGLGLAWLRLKSGTILVPILAHISANGFVTFLASLAPPPAG